MSDRSPDAIAQDLRALRPQKDSITGRWNALRAEFIKALGPRYEAGGVRLLTTRKFRWKPSIVACLIDRLEPDDLKLVLHPVAEEIERLYSDGKITLVDVRPHIAGIDLGYRLDFPLDKKRPEPKPTEKQEFQALVAAYEGGRDVRAES